MRMRSSQEKELHIIVLEMKSVQLALIAFLHSITGENLVLMSDSAAVVAHLKKQGGMVSRHVQTGSADHCMVRGDHGQHHSQAHSGEEEHFSRTIKLSGVDLYHRVGFSSRVFNIICMSSVNLAYICLPPG